MVRRSPDYKVSNYIRFYLSAREAKTPAIKKAYPYFRSYSAKRFHDPEVGDLGIDVKDLLEELLRYSNYYLLCNHPDVGVKEIDSVLRVIHPFDASVTHPYLLNLLDYRASGNIDGAAVAAVI